MHRMYVSHYSSDCDVLIALAGPLGEIMFHGTLGILLTKKHPLIGGFFIGHGAGVTFLLYFAVMGFFHPGDLNAVGLEYGSFAQWLAALVLAIVGTLYILAYINRNKALKAEILRQSGKKVIKKMIV